MTAEKEKVAPAKHRLLKICIMSALTGVLVGLAGNMYYSAYQSSQRSAERILSWEKAYKLAGGGPAKAWFSPESPEDCTNTLRRLDEAGYSYKVDDLVLEGKALITVCRKPGSHAIIYWR